MLFSLCCHPPDFRQHNLMQRHDFDGVGRTLVLVLMVSTTGVGVLLLIPASTTAEVVLCSAVLAFHQAGKHILFAHLVGSAFALTHLLHDVPSFPVNERFMGVLKPQPLFWRVVLGLFALE